MNKKGFTLVEVVVTVTIILLFAGIAVPSITKMLNRSKQKDFENTKEAIYNAYESYCSFNECTGEVQFNDLIKERLLDSDDLEEYYSNIDNCSINKTTINCTENR